MLRFEKLPKADDFYWRNCMWRPESWPIPSMYGIYTYIYRKNQPNVGKYTIHMGDKPAFQRPPSQFSQLSQHVFWVSVSSICSTLQENVILQWMSRKQTYFSAGNLHWITNALGTSLIYLDLPLLQVVGPWYTQVILFMKIWACINYDSLKPCKSCDIILMNLH